MKIETKQELKYIMDFYGIPFVTIFDEGKNLGKVTREMKYERGHFHSYRTGYEDLAFVRACEQISRDMEDIQSWKDISTRTFATTLLIGERNKEKRHEKWYCWGSDIEKCHLVMEKDDNGHVILKGRLNDLKNFRSYANDHMSYVRDSYSFGNEELNHYIELSLRYGLRNADDDGYEWWRVGIVD